MIDREDLTCWIHHSMAITGGYLGVYALLCRDDFFGNALTSNMIYIVTSLGSDKISWMYSFALPLSYYMWPAVRQPLFCPKSTTKSCTRILWQ